MDDTSITFELNRHSMTYNYRYLDTQNSVLNKNLMEFYANKDNLDKIMHIVHGKSRISLRIIDWFVTNYSKKHFVVYDPRTVDSESVYESGYMRMENGDMVYDSSGRFKVFNDYKMKLKAYSKKRFDPFCRWARIHVPVVGSDATTGEDHTEVQMNMETTLGQLNFFKWAIENRVLEYIESHYDAIERDMNMRNSNSKRRRSPQSVESRSSDEDAIDDGTAAAISESDFFQEEEEDEHTLEEESLIPTTSQVSDTYPSFPCATTSSLRSRAVPGATTRKKREELSIYACKCIKKESVKILVKFT